MIFSQYESSCIVDNFSTRSSRKFNNKLLIIQGHSRSTYQKKGQNLTSQTLELIYIYLISTLSADTSAGTSTTSCDDDAGTCSITFSDGTKITGEISAAGTVVFNQLPYAFVPKRFEDSVARTDFCGDNIDLTTVKFKLEILTPGASLAF